MSGLSPTTGISGGVSGTYQSVPPYLSTRWYLVGTQGLSVNPTNTSTLTTDKIYGIIGFVNTVVTLTGLAFRTSSSNASNGASLKFAIYSLDSSLLPTSRLAHTTTGVAVNNSATDSTVTGTFDAPVTLPAGYYLFCVLPTAITTAVRTTIYGANGWISSMGGSSGGNSFGTCPIGYTGTAVYATGFPATFPAATIQTSLSNYPVLSMGVQ